VSHRDPDPCERRLKPQPSSVQSDKDFSVIVTGRNGDELPVVVVKLL